MAKIIELKQKKGSKVKRQFLTVCEIAKESTISTLQNQNVYAAGVAVGLIQGLKYGGSVERGVKGGLATIGAMVVVDVVRNVFENIDVVKDA